MFVLVLFSHIVAVLTLSAAFALDWVALHDFGRRPPGASDDPMLAPGLARLIPRLHRAAGLLILVSGAYMSTELGLWGSGWITVSLAAVIVLAIAGAIGGARMRALAQPSGRGADARAARARAAAWLHASFRTRVSATVGIVYVMVAKPDFVTSLTVIAAAALAGAASTMLAWRSATRRAAAGDLNEAGA